MIKELEGLEKEVEDFRLEEENAKKWLETSDTQVREPSDPERDTKSRRVILCTQSLCCTSELDPGRMRQGVGRFRYLLTTERFPQLSDHGGLDSHML